LAPCTVAVSVAQLKYVVDRMRMVLSVSESVASCEGDKVYSVSTDSHAHAGTPCMLMAAPPLMLTTARLLSHVIATVICANVTALGAAVGAMIGTVGSRVGVGVDMVGRCVGVVVVVVGRSVGAAVVVTVVVGRSVGAAVVVDELGRSVGLCVVVGLVVIRPIGYVVG